MVKKKVCIPRGFLVINVCNQGKILCSPCIFKEVRLWQFCGVIPVASSMQSESVDLEKKPVDSPGVSGVYGVHEAAYRNVCKWT